MIVAMELDRSIDLRRFSGYLAQSGVRHRISEDGDRQVVRVYTEEDAERVRALYARLARGEISFVEREAPKAERRTRYPSLALQMRRAPLTVGIVLLNVALYPATLGLDEGHLSAMLRAMTFVEVHQRGAYLQLGQLSDTLASGQYWRLWSPMFLHFSVMHIVFNLLWVWEVGRRIEMVNGAAALLVIVLTTSLSANVIQYAMVGPMLFGGMSGVVFGLLGYCFVWSRLVPSRDMGLPVGVYVFMAVFLALGYLGVFDFLIPGKLANGAHLGGLVAGLGLGLVFALGARAGRQ